MTTEIEIATCTYCGGNGCKAQGGEMPCFASEAEGSVCECPECGRGCGDGWLRDDDATDWSMVSYEQDGRCPCGECEPTTIDEASGEVHLSWPDRVSGLRQRYAKPGTYYVVNCAPQGDAADEWTLQRLPPHTNMSRKPQPTGWCGENNNVSTYGRGTATVETDGTVTLSE